MTTLSRADLLADLQSMLMDSAGAFSDSDGDRQLDTAARDLVRVKPLIKSASLTLVADQSAYAAPDDLLRPHRSVWGLPEIRGAKNPWDADWPGELPRMIIDQDGILLYPPPTAAQITLLGSDYPYLYVAKWTIGDLAEETNIPDQHRDLLLIRAAAAAMQDLAGRGVTKPVQLGGCGGSPAANGTPAALAKELMERFERMAR